jgi:hypothetical protein
MKKRFSLGLFLVSLVACSGGMDGVEGAGGSGAELEPSGATEADPRAAAETNAPEVAEVQTKPLFVRSSATVVEAHGRSFVILGRGLDEGWARGAPSVVNELTDEASDVSVVQAIAPEALPSEVAHVTGRRVTLVGKSGGTCEAEVGAVVGLARLSPDSEAYSRYRGEGRDENGALLPKPSSAAIAAEVWAGTEDSHFVAAELRVLAGSCADASFALLDRGASYAVPHATSDSLRDRAIEAFHALPEYGAHRADYAEWSAPEGTSKSATWETHGENAIAVVEATVAGEELVWVSANVDGGCGDFGAQLSALYRKTRDASGAVSLVPVRVLDGYSSELRGLERTKEGFELYFPDVHVPAAPASEPENAEVSYYGCRC